MSARMAKKEGASVDVHPTAVVSPEAQLEHGVVVGPYSIIGPEVSLGARTKIASHAVLEGRVETGQSVQIGAHACIGQPPQDRKYDGAHTGVRIGDRAEIREFVTINRATEVGGWTVLGPDSMLMAYSHLAHDCQVGARVTVANSSMLAGHVTIADDATLGGRVLVQQFSRIGRWAFLAANACVERDVPPFCRVAGDRAHLAGLNSVGLRRSGLEPAAIRALGRAYRALFRVKIPLDHAVADVNQRWPEQPEVQELLRFIANSEKGICR